MLPAPPPRRPSPRPAARPAPGPAAQIRPKPYADFAEAADAAGAIDAAPTLPTPGAIDSRTPRTPRLLTAVRNHPTRSRRASVAAIGIGAVLFVAASLTTPLAGADLAHSKPMPTETQSSGPAFILPAAAAPTPVVAVRTLNRKPTESKNKAPIDHGAISALAGNGIPKVALNAYRVAAARMGNVQPGCGIDWSLIAGIGREESDHGRFAGAQLHSDGTSTPRIIGPALDGKRWDFIAAPGNGLALDGDAKYAHALGPMQFIPSTWAGYGADATGDGKADIFNINDAALGTARYLCAAGGDLRTQQGRIKAVLTYNHNDQYLAQVLALADAYKRGIPISGIPIGNIKGALPKVDTGYVPPANPGGPTAVDQTKGRGTKATPSKAPTPPRSTSPSGKHSATPSGTASGSGGAGKASGTRTPPKPAPTKTSPHPGSSTPPSSAPRTCTLLTIPMPCPSSGP